jgi:GT2 family glycosyltransferase
MSESSAPPRRSAGRDDYRELIHALHRRYYHEWRRAEYLERELARVRGRWGGALFAWLLYLKRWLRPADTTMETYSPEPCPTLEEDPGPVSGRVSIIIPFKDRLELLRGCLRSLRDSTYRDFEVVLVDNGSSDPRTARYLYRLRRRRSACVVDCPGPFNFSWLCNEGAKQATGEYLLFLNNDMEVLTPDWLQRLIRLAQRPEVGVAGATLLYPDGTIQHAGLFPRSDGRWVHASRGCLWGAAGQEESRQIRAVPAVSAACLMIRRELFTSLGGFDERLPVTYNDIDLCCRARDRQLLVAVSPHARLLHFECLSRGYAGDQPGEGHLAVLDDFPTEAAVSGP